MANQRWRERLIGALRRQGLPKDYVDRLVDELADHAVDLSKENNSMDAEQDLESRLGTPEQLAAVAKKEYQRRAFAGCYPILTFVVGPIIAVIGIFLTNLLLFLIAYGLTDWITSGSLTANDEQHLPPSSFELGLMQFANLVVRFVPFALSAWLFVYLGRRVGVQVWSVVACGIVSVIAILFWSVMEGPKPPMDMGMWTMGFGWRNEFGLHQILQAVIPLALGVWRLWQVSTIRWKTLAT